MNYALEINNLNKSHKKSDFKLCDISFNVPKGSIMGFVGKNGSGKSTTISTILNLIQRESGSVKFFGEEMIDNSKHLREDIGVVFDSLHFSKDLTAINLDSIFKDIYKNWDSDLFFSYLEKFNLEKKKKIKTFSRGMGMKLSIAVALSHKAKFLILDEATAGLDPVAREEILDMLLEFIEDENNSILISSHISSDLEKIADYITFIDNGKIILIEEKDKLIYNYGIAKMKDADFKKLLENEYLSFRKRGLQTEVLVKDKAEFLNKYPDIVVDIPSIDEILPMITKGDI